MAASSITVHRREKNTTPKNQNTPGIPKATPPVEFLQTIFSKCVGVRFPRGKLQSFASNSTPVAGNIIRNIVEDGTSILDDREYLAGPEGSEGLKSHLGRVETWSVRRDTSSGTTGSGWEMGLRRLEMPGIGQIAAVKFGQWLYNGGTEISRD